MILIVGYLCNGLFLVLYYIDSYFYIIMFYMGVEVFDKIIRIFI